MASRTCYTRTTARTAFGHAFAHELDRISHPQHWRCRKSDRIKPLLFRFCELVVIGVSPTTREDLLPPAAQIVSHWHHSVDAFNTSATDYYESVREALHPSQTPEIDVRGLSIVRAAS